MKTELKDVLHFYLGCDCLRSDGAIYTLLPSHFPSNWGSHQPNHKPTLRPLSDMQEEEKITIGLIIADKERKHYRNNDDLFAIEDAEAWAIRGGMKPVLSLTQTTKLTTFLLKQGFDLFDLIPSGQAIDKTTLNK